MSWKELLARVQPKDHLVQLYESDDSLTRRVSHYVSEGLELQEGVIAIAAEPHRELLAAQLAKDDVDVERVLGEGRLVLLDAEETLSRFMVEGRPDSELFQESLGSVIDGVRDAGRFRGMRL
ncbi:MAG TPA: MEDS domain-containing protein, partial [Planctomycetota bacterium]|nr:MEDS domain-containing protein [Planctomycetota bacterium]